MRQARHVAEAVCTEVRAHRELAGEGAQVLAHLVAGARARLAVRVQRGVQLSGRHAVAQHRAVPVMRVDQAQRLCCLLHLAQQHGSVLRDLCFLVWISISDENVHV